MKNVKNIIKGLLIGTYALGGIIISSFVGYNGYTYASTSVNINQVQVQQAKEFNTNKEMLHRLATVTDYNKDTGIITVNYNGQYHQFTSNSQYQDYAKEQYSQLAQYKICTLIVIDNNGNIDEDTKAFDSSANIVVDARTNYINNNKDNPNGFKTNYEDGSYEISNKYINRYICYNAVNKDCQSWLSDEDMQDYIKTHWNKKIPVTGVPCSK